MPNWTDHTLQVAGPKELVDRWWTQALVTGKQIGDFQPRSVHISFTKLCPPRTAAEKRAAAKLPSGVVYYRWRTWTQASVHFVCAWDTPVYFFRALPRYWKGLALRCMVDEEMSQFGGYYAVLGGKLIDTVATFDTSYNERAHVRTVRKLQARWRSTITRGRPFSATPPLRNGRVFECDATFDLEEGRLYFRTKPGIRDFVERYGGAGARQLAGGHWRPMSLRARRPTR